MSLHHWYCCCHCSVTKSCLALCGFVDSSMPGSPLLYYLLEFAQIHMFWVGDAIQQSHPLSQASAFYQHQGIFQWVSFSHLAAKVLELQLQHQFFQKIFMFDFFSIDWFDVLAGQETHKSFLQPHNSKSSILQYLVSFTVLTFFMAFTSLHDNWKKS